MTKDIHDLISFTVTAEDAGKRLDVYLTTQLSCLEEMAFSTLEKAGVTRAKVQALIKNDGVKVNAKKEKPGYVLRVNDTIVIEDPSRLYPTPPNIEPIEMPLDILFEDDDVIVLNKPAGLVVHPGAGEKVATLAHGLLAYLTRDQKKANLQRAGIVHRLDKDTTGVMVCAKNEKAHIELAKQFATKEAGREYMALLDGFMQTSEKMVEGYLFRDPKNRLKFASISKSDLLQKLNSLGKEVDENNVDITDGYRYARSLFVRIATYKKRISLVKVRLFTGRTHQIRVHAKDLKLPVLGDLTYHTPQMLPQDFSPDIRNFCQSLGRQMLHAEILTFRHPVSKSLSRFQAPIPEDFNKLLKMLESYKD